MPQCSHKRRGYYDNEEEEDASTAIKISHHTFISLYIQIRNSGGVPDDDSDSDMEYADPSTYKKAASACFVDEPLYQVYHRGAVMRDVMETSQHQGLESG